MNSLKESLASRRPQFLTMFADASHCPNTLATGWAVWMKYGTPATTERLSGALTDVKDSHAAEIIALQEGLTFIEERIDVTGQIVVIESDCKGALNHIDARAMALMERGARHVKLKWVKGHQGVKCARSSVNTWCDKKAKSHMRELRDTIYRESGATTSIYAPKGDIA